MSKQHDDDLYQYRFIGPLTILQTMALLAVLGIILTVLSHYYLS